MSIENSSVIEINGQNQKLVQTLLQGKLVVYHDSRYEVTTQPHEILMKLLQNPDEMTIFYIHVPYAYPMPDGIQVDIKEGLELELHRKIHKVTFVNVGTEIQKKDLQFRIELGGSLNE